LLIFLFYVTALENVIHRPNRGRSASLGTFDLHVTVSVDVRIHELELIFVDVFIFVYNSFCSTCESLVADGKTPRRILRLVSENALVLRAVFVSQISQLKL
jgi:hypothetical protein